VLPILGWIPAGANSHKIKFNTINVCINTSVSALDKPHLLSNAIAQYKRVKPYCKSILRIVSCDFNESNKEGKRLAEIQRRLFKNEDCIDTVLRVNKRNKLATDGIINIKPANFLGKKCFISKYNPKTYFGKCANCHEMCGANIAVENYHNRIPIVSQPTLFKRL